MFSFFTCSASIMIKALLRQCLPCSQSQLKLCCIQLWKLWIGEIMCMYLCANCWQYFSPLLLWPIPIQANIESIYFREAFCSRIPGYQEFSPKGNYKLAPRMAGGERCMWRSCWWLGTVFGQGNLQLPVVQSGKKVQQWREKQLNSALKVNQAQEHCW